MSTRRRPITSPPGGGSLIWPHRARSGPASRIDARIFRHSCGSRIRRAHRLRVDAQRVRPRPFEHRAGRLHQLHQRLDVANARDVLEQHRVFGEQRRANDWQRRVLVARRSDVARQSLPALDDILQCAHSWPCSMGVCRIERRMNGPSSPNQWLGAESTRGIRSHLLRHSWRDRMPRSAVRAAAGLAFALDRLPAPRKGRPPWPTRSH